METVRNAVKKFLSNKAKEPLVNWWHEDLETQVQVISHLGESTNFGGYTQDGDTWYHIRWPKNGKVDPTWDDTKRQTFLLDDYADFIGTSGWNWVTRRSEFVCFDFDSVANHAGGLTEKELENLIESGRKLDYVDVLASTSGKGVHYYVRFDPDDFPPAQTRVEHKQISHYILSKLKQDVGEKLVANLDVCGNIFWIWSRKMNEDSYKHLSKATNLIKFSEFVTNWEEQAESIKTPYTPTQKKISYVGSAPIGTVHEKILKKLEQENFSFSFDRNEKRVTTHTKALQNVAESMSDFVGAFKTRSQGTDAKQNCFMFPVDNGGFTVFRFGNVEEDFPWKVSKNDNYYCMFNSPLEPIETFLHFSMEHQPKSGQRKERFCAETYEDLQNALEFLGCNFELDETLRDCADYYYIELVPTTSDSLRVCFDADKSFAPIIKKQGFTQQGRNLFRSKIIKYKHARFGVYKDVKKEREKDIKDEQIIQLEGLEHLARHTKRYAVEGVETSQEGQWWVGTDIAGEGHKFCKVKNDSDVVKALQAEYKGLSTEEGKVVCGGLLRNPWVITCNPFEPEYGRERQWNMNAPKLKFSPAPLDDCDEAIHPMWDKILSHCGSELDEALVKQPWFDYWGLHTGKEYLTAWIACMLFEPDKKLPYLFLHGNQNTGKSSLHLAASELMCGGVVDGSRPLTNTSSFNGELDGQVLVTIEEVDLTRKNWDKNTAYERIKDWTVNPILTIRKMYHPPFPTKNYLHFIQVANKISSCPIDEDDTRITALLVPPFKGKEISETDRNEALIEEAPNFMVTLKRAHRRLPPMTGRLRIPVVKTSSKEQVIDATSNELLTFIREHCIERPTKIISLNSFYTRFLQESSSDVHEGSWTTSRVKKELMNAHYRVTGVGESTTIQGLELKK